MSGSPLSPAQPVETRSASPFFARRSISAHSITRMSSFRPILARSDWSISADSRGLGLVAPPPLRVNSVMTVPCGTPACWSSSRALARSRGGFWLALL
ncbi:hypothetical protein D3C81_1779900 [compost metagenome]